MLQISMRSHVANVHIDGVTVCSDSRDRKNTCYNAIDGQITRPICSKDKVHVLIAKVAKGINQLTYLLVTSDLIEVRSQVHNISSHKILCDFT